MHLPEENPPRRLNETALYEDDPFALGEVDEEAFVVVEDFLPQLPAMRPRPGDEPRQRER